jgi:hypothetical protein
MIDLDGILKVVNAIVPLLTGVLGVSATLFGVNLNNKWQDRRDINNTRSQSIGKLFAYINESERNIMKIKLSIKGGGSVDSALNESTLSMKNLLREYDKSAVYLPDSIAQIVERVLSQVAAINAFALMGDKAAALRGIADAESNMRQDKKELRNVFQYMIGVKK